MPPSIPKNLKKGVSSGFWAVIYPNPSAGEMTINTFDDQILQVEMFDAIGNLVYKNNLVENKTKLNFASYTNGLYSVILRDVHNSRSYKTFKWVISK